ncbi:unnamed protein product [Protopolystoma xenopodis]|uniref:PUM-HD domain-containing protein n=1 Tax=Protopolystoma xenopodis TaxID=117903 RepID=A0A448XNX2_9PLAT|nr:unnamed protein product [Protopolystoma xenopodis]
MICILASPTRRAVGSTFTLILKLYSDDSHVLEHGAVDDKSRIISRLKGRVPALSAHKFASNVMEKAIANASPNERVSLINEVLYSSVSVAVSGACGGDLAASSCLTDAKVGGLGTGDSASGALSSSASGVNSICTSQTQQQQPPLVDMMKDQFANYVVQRMLELADGQQRRVLISRIRPMQGLLRKFNYGKHIIAKLEKYSSSSSGGGNCASGSLSSTASSTCLSSVVGACGTVSSGLTIAQSPSLSCSLPVVSTTSPLTSSSYSSSSSPTSPPLDALAGHAEHTITKACPAYSTLLSRASLESEANQSMEPGLSVGWQTQNGNNENHQHRDNNCSLRSIPSTNTNEDGIVTTTCNCLNLRVDLNTNSS